MEPYTQQNEGRSGWLIVKKAIKGFQRISRFYPSRRLNNVNENPKSKPLVEWL